MTTQNLLFADVSLTDSQIDLNTSQNQHDPTDSLFTNEDDENLDEHNEELDDEPIDQDGDPAGMPDHGEHDHHQDDNYALGGHVTRSGS